MSEAGERVSLSRHADDVAEQSPCGSSNSVSQRTGVAAMTVTTIDIDDAALEAVLRCTGLRTKSEAVNVALRDYVEHHQRRAAYERLAEVGRQWDAESWRARRENNPSA
jgi:Arc/MetJ family transcription regulator